jgi:hypothetical protein
MPDLSEPSPNTLSSNQIYDFLGYNKVGKYIFKQPNYKLPLKGLEPLHLAPEASALSSELQGLFNFE